MAASALLEALDEQHRRTTLPEDRDERVRHPHIEYH
jgi:hypothetical protein